MADHGGDQRSVLERKRLTEWRLRKNKNTVIFYTFCLQFICSTVYSLNPNKLLLNIVKGPGKLRH